MFDIAIKINRSKGEIRRLNFLPCKNFQHKLSAQTFLPCSNPTAHFSSFGFPFIHTKLENCLTLKKSRVKEILARTRVRAGLRDGVWRKSSLYLPKPQMWTTINHHSPHLLFKFDEIVHCLAKHESTLLHTRMIHQKID